MTGLWVSLAAEKLSEIFPKLGPSNQYIWLRLLCSHLWSSLQSRTFLITGQRTLQCRGFSCTWDSILKIIGCLLCHYGLWPVWVIYAFDTFQFTLSVVFVQHGCIKSWHRSHCCIVLKMCLVHVCLSHMLIVIWFMNSLIQVFVIFLGLDFSFKHISPVRHHILGVCRIQTIEILVLNPTFFRDFLVFLRRSFSHSFDEII